MNKLRLSSLLISVSFCVSSIVCAQTAKWSIKPEYTSLSSYCEGVYKVRKNAQVGLIDENGVVIVPATADSITHMVENYSLILELEGGKYRLKGIFSNDKKVIPITNEYYVDQYPFFSEGKLPVCNLKGKYGFINTNGRLVLDFEYGTIHPFSNGLASVSKKNLIGNVTSLIKKSKGSVIYIDENGQELKLPAEIGDIYSGTTFKNGEALVTNKGEKQYVISNTGSIVRIDNSIALIFDDRYSLVSDNNKNDIIQAETIVYDGPTTFTENGLYGYRLEEAIILPAQFTEALPFSKGYAIAGKDGKKGILKLVNGSFSGQQAKGSLVSSDQQKEAVDYLVEIPEEWKNESLKLSFLSKDKNSNINASLPGDGASTRTFSFLLPKEREEGKVMLEGGTLVLWKNTMEDARAIAAASIKITVTPETSKANAKDNANISIRLTNQGQKPQELSIKISGDRLKPVEKKVTLQPNSGERISAYFYKVTKKEKRNLIIETSFMDAISKDIWVIPFFTEY